MMWMEIKVMCRLVDSCWINYIQDNDSPPPLERQISKISSESDGFWLHSKSQICFNFYTFLWFRVVGSNCKAVWREERGSGTTVELLRMATVNDKVEYIEEKTDSTFKDSWMASIINTIFGSDRTNHVAYLRVLILVSRLLTYIYFALWPTLHLR